MAHVDKKHFGKGTSGKGSGSSSMIDLERDMLGENEVLSNHDKRQQPDERGRTTPASRRICHLIRATGWGRCGCGWMKKLPRKAIPMAAELLVCGGSQERPAFCREGGGGRVAS